MAIKTGLYFGSFNPIHIGHLAIANYMLEFSDLEEIWFVVSPASPFKTAQRMLPERERYNLIEIALSGAPGYRVSDVEFTMPKPSYTIDTLARLSDRHPNREFALIMGSDNLRGFEKWKNFGVIVERYHRYVYPRASFDATREVANLENATIVAAPEIEISSSMIRAAIGEGKDVRFLLPAGVYEYIDEMNYYKL